MCHCVLFPVDGLNKDTQGDEDIMQKTALIDGTESTYLS